MRNDSNVVVGCDLDGVISDIVRQLVRFSRSKHSVSITKRHIVSENIETCTSLQREQLHDFFQNAEFFRSLPMVPHSRVLLARLKAAGCSVHIITDRFWYEGIRKDTTDWLVRHRIPFESLVFARKAEKQDVAKSLNAHFFIEDQLSNARLLAPLCRVLLLDRPYNQGELPDQVTRVNDLKAAVDLIVEWTRGLDLPHTSQRAPLRCPA
jgi:uncharacterized HAD superfamily protein